MSLSTQWKAYNPNTVPIGTVFFFEIMPILQHFSKKVFEKGLQVFKKMV